MPSLVALTFLSSSWVEAGITLSFHDAQLIAERTPAFLDAERTGECPEISDGTLNGPIATFIIRSGCGHDVSGYILGVYVDTRTGAVTRDNGTLRGLEIHTPELAEIVEKLFADRAAARVTRREAMCLLRSAGSPAAGQKTCAGPTILAEEDDRFVGSLGAGCNSAGRELAVDRFTGKVTDLGTGVAYSSQKIDQLRADIAASHSDARLSLDDARSLAAAYVDTLGPASGKCVDLRLDPRHTADEIWLIVSRGCGGGSDLAVLSINVMTGGLRVVGPNTSPDSPQLRALRGKMLGEARSRKLLAEGSVRMKCAE